jgi:MFS family permease
MTATTLTMRGPAQSAGTAIALVALALLGGSAARAVLSPLQELMQSDLGFSDNQVSLIQGAAMALPLVVVSMPLGRLVDRASRTRLLIALALLCAVGSALTAIAHSFAVMFVARMMVGVAGGAALPAAVSLAADLSRQGNRSKVMALLGMGQNVGVGGAFFLAGGLLNHLPAALDAGAGFGTLASWRVVQLLFSGGMLALALVLFLLREPARQEVEQAEVKGLRAVLVELAEHRRVLVPLVVGMISVSMADAAANIWAVPVLTRSLHLQPAEFGAWMGLLLLTAGFLGVIVGGVAGDLGQRLGGKSGLLGAAAVVATLATPMAFFPVMSSVWGFAALLGLLILFGASAGIIGTAAITVAIPNELRGVSLSLVATIGILVGLGVAPTLVSFMAQVTGDGADIRMPLTVVGLTASVVSVAAYLIAMRAARAADAH